MAERPWPPPPPQAKVVDVGLVLAQRTWTQDLEEATQHLGDFRTGPRLNPMGNSAADRLLVACQARQLDPDILQVQVEKDGKRKKVRHLRWFCLH